MIGGELALERFEYTRVGDRIAVARLLARLGASLGVPARARLVIDWGADGTRSSYPARACAVECRLLDRRDRAACGTDGELLWRAAFAIPFEIIESEDSIFQLTVAGAPALALPAPRLRNVNRRPLALAAAPGIAAHPGLTGGHARRRFVALATAVAVTSTSAPGAALADAGSSAGSASTSGAAPPVGAVTVAQSPPGGDAAPTAPGTGDSGANAMSAGASSTAGSSTTTSSATGPTAGSTSATAPSATGASTTGTPSPSGASATTNPTTTTPAAATSASTTGTPSASGASATTTPIATGASATSTPSAPADTTTDGPAAPAASGASLTSITSADSAAPALTSAATGGTTTATLASRPSPSAPSPSRGSGGHLVATTLKTGLARHRRRSRGHGGLSRPRIVEFLSAGAEPARPPARRGASSSSGRSVGRKSRPVLGGRLTFDTSGNRLSASWPEGGGGPAVPGHVSGARHADHERPPAAPPISGGAPLGLTAPLSSSGASPGAGISTGSIGKLSSAPGFVAPAAWTGTVSTDPALTGAVSDLSGLLSDGDRPPSFLIPIYMQAGRRYHVPWEVLAAINAVETDYGRDLSTSSAGAIGWMQFEPSTWRQYGVAVDGHSVPNAYDPRDAIFAAARYLAAAGAAQDLYKAVYAYNHAGWYVVEVLSRAEAIAAHVQFEHQTIKHGIFSVDFASGIRRQPTVSYSGGVLSHFDRVIAAANMVSAANFPYLWGGGHEQPASFGPFDCSGSVSYVIQQAGYKVSTTVSGDVPIWRFPAGPGRVTIFYNAVHTFMRIGSRYFGTSGFARPGGGAGWFDVNRLPASYLAQFREVHLPHLGVDAFAPDSPRR
ncbi:MAG: lytic murein transglycosylase [Solirubrobacteraceae bacterium]